MPCRANRFSKQPSQDRVVSTTGGSGLGTMRGRRLCPPGHGGGGAREASQWSSCLYGELREGFARWPAGWLAVVRWDHWVPFDKWVDMWVEIWVGLSWVILLFFVAETDVI